MSMPIITEKVEIFEDDVRWLAHTKLATGEAARLGFKKDEWKRHQVEPVFLFNLENTYMLECMRDAQRDMVHTFNECAHLH